MPFLFSLFIHDPFPSCGGMRVSFTTIHCYFDDWLIMLFFVDIVLGFGVNKPFSNDVINYRFHPLQTKKKHTVVKLMSNS